MAENERLRARAVMTTSKFKYLTLSFARLRKKNTLVRAARLYFIIQPITSLISSLVVVVS